MTPSHRSQPYNERLKSPPRLRLNIDLVISIFANILLHIPLKIENKMKKVLSPVYSLKLKNIILFLIRGLIFIFFKLSYSQTCFDVAQGCENLC